MVQPQENKAFLSQGTYGCAMYPRIKCDGKQSVRKNKKREISKIVEDNAISQNEISIGKKVFDMVKHKKEKPLIGVHRFCKVKKSNLTHHKKCDILKKEKSKKNNTSFLILYSTYVPSISVRSYLKTDFNVNSMIQLYQFMIDALQLMHENELVHNDLTGNNIIYSTEEKQFHIIDFGLSFFLPDCFVETKGVYELNEEYLRKIFFPDVEFFMWPLEHHFLGYMVRYGKKPSQEKLLSMIETYYSNPKNSLFVENDNINDYIFHVYDFYMTTYIRTNRSVEEDIQDILRNASLTWDLHSFSYTLLRRLKSTNFIHTYGTIVNVLFQALHYDYAKRPLLSVHQKELNHIKELH